MAISTLLPAGGANDNRPNLKQFFGKNPAIANDNVERVSSGMFSNTFVDSVVQTLHSLIEEIAKINDIAKSVIASFGAIVKSLKNLNKEVTTRFRVLNNEMNASRIDFIRTVLAIPKTDTPVKIDGVPVNVNAPQEEPKKEEDKGDFFKDLFEKLILGWITKNLGPTALKMLQGLLSVAQTLISLAAELALGLVKQLPGLIRMLATFLASPVGGMLAAGAIAGILIYKGLDELTKAIMADPDWDKFLAGKAFNPDGTKKTDEQLRQEAVGDIAKRNKPQEFNQRYNNRADAFKNNTWGDDGKPIQQSEVGGFFSPPNSSDEIWKLKKPLKDGTKFINITTGEKYLDTSNDKGVFKTVPTPGSAPAAAPAPAGDGTPTPSGGPAYRYPGFKDLNESRSTSTGPSKVTSGEVPAGAPAGEVKKESNTPAPPPGAPSGTGTVTAPTVPTGAATSTGGASSAGGGVAVVQNSSVQNVGSVGGAENGGMTGQNLPMFARNDKLQSLWGRQTLAAHQ
jgi:hypothetical protein